jgi:hypothetical protein
MAVQHRLAESVTGRFHPLRIGCSRRHHPRTKVCKEMCIESVEVAAKQRGEEATVGPVALSIGSRRFRIRPSLLAFPYCNDTSTPHVEADLLHLLLEPLNDPSVPAVLANRRMMAHPG